MTPPPAHIDSDATVDEDNSGEDVEDITGFTDLGLDLPFEYGDAIYDTKRDVVRVPRAIAPTDDGGFAVVCHTYQVREHEYRGELKVTDGLGGSADFVSMRLLRTLMNADKSKVIGKDRVVA